MYDLILKMWQTKQFRTSKDNKKKAVSISFEIHQNHIKFFYRAF